MVPEGACLRRHEEKNAVLLYTLRNIEIEVVLWKKRELMNWAGTEWHGSARQMYSTALW
jgi:hypothetical protein